MNDFIISALVKTHLDNNIHTIGDVQLVVHLQFAPKSAVLHTLQLSLEQIHVLHYGVQLHSCHQNPGKSIHNIVHVLYIKLVS